MIDLDQPELPFGMFEEDNGSITTGPDPRARNSDPETSHEAASSMVSEAQNQRIQIYAWLKGHGPMTADELDDALNFRLTSSGRRLPELLEAGKVERLKETRKTRSNRRAHLWGAI